MPRTRRKDSSETSFWVGYTDLLSNSLLILLITIVVAALARATNDRPPLVSLTERESFRFATGSYFLNPQFKAALDQRLPDIRSTIRKYRIDVVEVIGHTDGQPSPGMSNLDLLLPTATGSVALQGYRSGSNSDLGLLRALSVANYLRTKLSTDESERLLIRPYSASSLVDTDGRYNPADLTDRGNRRRIELRFTRQVDE
jgi:outer membrane protein OmpA-like peptidoglycan-associated protein